MKCRLGSFLTGGLLAAVAGLVITIPVLILVEYLRSKEKVSTGAGDEPESELEPETETDHETD
ncbi:MAG: hypothetical protein OXH56_13125 [Gemmatimonadetes bacterium]|nr:hypothetical protein [Gemmatimonadota bacterium]